jgi:hypothetical protein
MVTSERARERERERETRRKQKKRKGKGRETWNASPEEQPFPASSEKGFYQTIRGATI